tara:strand:+ start:897 stop:1052 length:156 start_codon:yes stop_codon:yes gene_type:complete
VIRNVFAGFLKDDCNVGTRWGILSYKKTARTEERQKERKNGRKAKRAKRKL